MLHYLHSVDVATAFAPPVAALHDAMLIASDQGADGTTRLRFGLVCAAVGDLTDTFPVDGKSSDEPEAPDPDTTRTGADRSDDETSRRSRLHQLVHRDGWDWSAVTGPHA